MGLLKGEIFLSFFILVLLMQVGNCNMKGKIFPGTPSISNLNLTRLLQAQRPHGFRIHGELLLQQPEIVSSSVIAGGITLFSVSQLYFMKTIMVNNMAQSDTIYNPRRISGSVCI
jgi:hypothetical protein